MIGMRTNEWAKYMHDDLSVPLAPDAIAERVIERVRQRIVDSVPVLPGAERALQRLASRFELGLATSAATAVAHAVLDATGWKRYFRQVVSADEVGRGKPSPDVYLRALDLLRADPPATVAVEDSANGIRSAHAAAIAVVAIPNREFPPEPEALALASRVLTSLDDLDF